MVKIIKNKFDPDPVLFIAASIVCNAKFASITLLRNRLRVTFKIAVEIIRQLELIGIIEKNIDCNYKCLIEEYELLTYCMKFEEINGINITIGGRCFSQ
jgi:hypothetical protein